MIYVGSKPDDVSMIFRIAIYQPVVTLYQARCYGISVLGKRHVRADRMIRHELELDDLSF